MRVLSLALLLAVVLGVPPAQADVLQDADCTNRTVFVQAGLENEHTCDGECENTGVFAQVGLHGGSTCTSCENRGVYVFVGDHACGTYHGAVACYGETCIDPCLRCESDTAAPSSCTVQFYPPHGAARSHGHVGLRCGNEPCGAAQDLLCWTAQFLCWYVGDPLADLAPPDYEVHCDAP